MKLVIQIPCYNEEQTLETTIRNLPTNLSELGIKSIEILVIDDGSTDSTAKIARAMPAVHVVSLPRHQGLAKAYVAGLRHAVSLSADVIVNTDADNQYDAADLPKMLKPIIEGRADLVVGERPLTEIAHFSLTKRLFHRLGNWMVRRMTGVPLTDAVSGFRAMTCDLAERINVFGNYTYTIETLIQTCYLGARIEQVQVRINPPLRDSRLIQGTPSYLVHQFAALVKTSLIYRPLFLFGIGGTMLLLMGGVLGLRFLYFYLFHSGQGHIQSLVLVEILMGGGFLLIVAGIVAHLVAINRILLEEMQWRLRRIERRFDSPE
jgi:glycosyltransferase involved in cell wall biosynthesis